MKISKKAITDLPEDGTRIRILGTVEDPKPYWVTYHAATGEYVRD